MLAGLWTSGGGDGCSSICEVEVEFVCTGEPSVCLTSVIIGTIAGSEKTQTLAVEGTRTLLSGLEGEPVCATIINRSEKTASIQLTLTDDAGPSDTTKLIAKGESAALCGVDTASVAVECLGPSKCAFTWSVDRY